MNRIKRKLIPILTLIFLFSMTMAGLMVYASEVNAWNPQPDEKGNVTLNDNFYFDQDLITESAEENGWSSIVSGTLSIDSDNNKPESLGGALKITTDDNQASGRNLTYTVNNIAERLESGKIYTAGISSKVVSQSDSVYVYLNATLRLVFESGSYDISITGLNTNASDNKNDTWVTNFVQFGYFETENGVLITDEKGNYLVSKDNAPIASQLKITYNNMTPEKTLFLDDFGVFYQPNEMPATTYDVVAVAKDKSGNILEGVEFTVKDLDGNVLPVQPEKTETDGEVTFKMPMPDRYIVGAKKDGIDFVQSELAVSGNAPFRLEFIEKEQYTAELTVLDEEGNNISGAIVNVKTLAGEIISSESVIEENDVYKVALDAPSTLYVFKAGYISDEIEVSASDNAKSIVLKKDAYEHLISNYSLESQNILGGKEGQWKAVTGISANGISHIAQLDHSTEIAKTGLYSLKVSQTTGDKVAVSGNLHELKNIEYNVYYTFGFSTAMTEKRPAGDYYSYIQYELALTTNSGAVNVYSFSNAAVQHSAKQYEWKDWTLKFAIVQDDNNFIIVDEFGTVITRGAGEITGGKFTALVQNGANVFFDDIFVKTDGEKASYNVKVNSMNSDGNLSGVTYTVLNAEGEVLNPQPQQKQEGFYTIFSGITEKVIVRAEKSGVEFVTNLSSEMWYSSGTSYTFYESENYDSVITVLDIFGSALEGCEVTASYPGTEITEKAKYTTDGKYVFELKTNAQVKVEKSGYVYNYTEVNMYKPDANIYLYETLPQSASNIVSDHQATLDLTSSTSSRASLSLNDKVSYLKSGKTISYSTFLSATTDMVLEKIEVTITIDTQNSDSAQKYKYTTLSFLNQTSLRKGFMEKISFDFMVEEISSDRVAISSNGILKEYIKSAGDGNLRVVNFNIFFYYGDGLGGNKLMFENATMFSGYDANIVVPEEVTGIKAYYYYGGQVDENLVSLTETGYKINGMKVPVYIVAEGIDSEPLLITSENSSLYRVIKPYNLTITLVSTTGEVIEGAIVTGVIDGEEKYFLSSDTNGQVIFEGLNHQVTITAIKSGYIFESINFAADKESIYLFATPDKEEETMNKPPENKTGCSSTLDGNIASTVIVGCSIMMTVILLIRKRRNIR